MQDEHSARCIFTQKPAISIWAAVQLSRSSIIHELCSTDTTLVLDGTLMPFECARCSIIEFAKPDISKPLARNIFMAENSKIEWCDHTFNPWIGCQKVSPGCDHCYAEHMADHRFG